MENEKCFKPCCVCKKSTDKKCSGCKSEYYCSRDCQKFAWKSHKSYCRQLRLAGESDDADIVEYIDTSELDISVEVRKSIRHSLGVFATKKIKKNTPICFFHGKYKSAKMLIKMTRTNDGILSIKNADEVFKSMSDPTDINMCLSHPNPKKQMIIIGSPEFDGDFGVGQFINDFSKPDIQELDFRSALKALNDYESLSIKNSNCQLSGSNMWIESTKDIQDGEEILLHYSHRFWLQKYLAECDDPKWRLLYYSLQDQNDKPFDLRKFFTYDDATCSSFLITMLKADVEIQEKMEKAKPKDILMNLTEEIHLI